MIKGNTTHLSMCAHAIQDKHSFEFDHSGLVHRCKQSVKRQILDSLYIKLENNSVTTRLDLLDNGSSYKYIL